MLFLDDKNKPVGLLSLLDMIKSLAGKTKSIGISLKEVSSKLKQVNGGEPPD
ncbi:MAG: hypothetical protein LYZ69_04260 [Nitrososphaerales archaeon]|nr:hypothetical protein [Nitrososphaerales archaeon]